ncbi:MAG: TlpA family protein disulfide reductase [Marinobacterium sp.]|nr:TlpA family protein disulfide reductase [Marinobacterium sp.]
MSEKPSWITRLAERLKRIRWRRLLIEMLIALAIFIAIDQWRSKDLLATAQTAPQSVLPTLAGKTAALPARGTTLVYFFAPWCTVCHLSIGNLKGLAVQQPELNIQLVALDYQSTQEVREFIADQQLPFPVLMGNSQTFGDWQIRAYPTYYLVDGAGTIQARSMGYSTQVGLWVRSVL